MEEKKFIGRQEELTLFNTWLKRKGPELLILYGRRRVGKTRLLQEVTKQLKVDVVVMMEDADYNTNLAKFSEAIASHFSFPSFSPRTFKEAFEHIPQKSIIIIDEFSYIATYAIGEFQGIWEEIAKKKELKIILSGSLIRVMEELTFSLKSPLYGRATGVIKLMPLSFQEVCLWYRNAPVEKIMLLYFIVGGIPRYLEVIEEPTEEEIKRVFFTKNGLLLREGKLLLKENFPGSFIFPKIMFSVASGQTEATKIANQSNVKAGEVSKYLSLLEEYGYIKKRFPILGGGKKDVRFFMADRFFSFWSEFIWPFYGELEIGNNTAALSDFDKKKKYLFASGFEDVIEELLSSNKYILPFTAEKVGKQWGRTKETTYEIDIVAIHNQKKAIFFGECKWQENVDAEKVLDALYAKIKYIDWHQKERTEYFGVFARSFSKRCKEYMGKKVLCIESRDLGKVVKG